MRRNRSNALLGCVLAVLMVTVLFAPAVAAQSTQESDETNRSYQIVQGDQVIQLDPIRGDETTEEFYDYRHPHVGSRDDPSWGRSFSSRGTAEYQQDDTSVLMLYDGPDGVSFVAVHDRYHEEQAKGTTGGSVSWTVSGLPDEGEWAVIDDEYGWLTNNDTKDDIFQFDFDHRAGAPGNDGRPPADVDARLSWVWLTGRSDGVAYRGLGGDEDVSVTIDPSFNENSYHRYGDYRRADTPPDRPDAGERYNGTIDDWQVIVPSDDDKEFERVSLDSLEEPVEIRATASPPATREVRLESDTIEPDETARLTAVIENNGETDWAHEATFRIGDTELDTETMTVPAGEERTVEFSQEFSEEGVYELSVDGERTTLTVGDPESTDNTSDDDETTSDDETTEQAPGFGLVVALLAVVAATVIATRRTDS